MCTVSTERDRKLCSHCESRLSRLYARAQKSGRSSVCTYCTDPAPARVMYDSDPERKSETPLLTDTPSPVVPLPYPARVYPACTPPRGSLTGERRVEETVYGFFAPLPAPLAFPRRQVHRTQRTRGRDGCRALAASVSGYRSARRVEGEPSPSLLLRLPLRHLPAREPSRFPSSPRSPRSFFPAPLPSRERGREKSGERERERRGGGAVETYGVHNDAPRGITST